MRVLITGAAGFIGSCVCRKALELNWDVVALCHRHTERLHHLQGRAGFNIEWADLLDGALLARIIEERQIEAICHLAVVPPGGDIDYAQRINVEGTRLLAEVANRYCVRRFVYASTMSVYNFLAPQYIPVDEKHATEPLQAYGREKLAGEVACLELDAQAAVLRLAGIYGPDRRSGAVYNFIRAIESGQKVEIETDRAVDLLCVEDAAEALIGALDRSASGVYNIGYGEAVALSALAGEIAHLLKAELKVDIKNKGTAFFMSIERARHKWGFTPQSREKTLGHYIDWIKRNAD